MTTLFTWSTPSRLYFTRHKAIPPRSLLAASWISTTSVLEVFTNTHSAGCNGLINLTGKPDANAFTSVLVKLTLLPGFRIIEKSLMTGLFFLYFKPNHNLRVEMLSGVTSTGVWSGPVVEPFCTDEINPSLYNPKAICKCKRENGTDVAAMCTFVQFFTCAQKFAKWTNDMAVVVCLWYGLKVKSAYYAKLFFLALDLCLENECAHMIWHVYFSHMARLTPRSIFLKYFLICLDYLGTRHPPGLRERFRRIMSSRLSMPHLREESKSRRNCPRFGTSWWLC